MQCLNPAPAKPNTEPPILRIDNGLGVAVINVDLLRTDFPHDIVTGNLVDHSILSLRGSDHLSTRWLLSVRLLGSTVEDLVPEALVPPLLSVCGPYRNSTVRSPN